MVANPLTFKRKGFFFFFFFFIFEQANDPVHSRSYKTDCVPRVDSDQPAHLCGLINIFAGHSVGVAKDPKRAQVDSKDFDQPARMHRLI